MEYDRGHENQAVEAVQQAAVSGKDDADVLDAHVALDRRNHQVAQLPKDADPDPQRYKDRQPVGRRAAQDKMEQQGDNRAREDEAPRVPATVFPGLVLGSSLVLPKALPTQ